MNAVFCDVTPYGFYNNRRFGKRTDSISRVKRINQLVTGNAVPSSPIPVTLMMEAKRSSETSLLTRAIRRTIPEDVILHSDRRENLICYAIQLALQ
jgi:hypothetical protein